MNKSGCCIVLLCLITTAQCSTNIIKAPLSAGNDSWRVSIDDYTDGPDRFFGTMNVYRGGSGTESYYPPESENGLLWMRLTVANTGASARAFKFNRVRLIGADFVSNGRIVFSRLPFAEEGPSITLKPGCTASRWVVFTRSKNSLPYMLVYDDVENNEIVDRMTINLPDHAMDE